MSLSLYVKTHNKTGLKYLGKTKSDPHKYPGSGTRWSRHIKKHGDDVTTEVLKECKTNKEVKRWGVYYSNLWNVVKDKKWANIKTEEGQGGWDHVHSRDIREKATATLKTNTQRLKEHGRQLGLSNRGRKHPEEVNKKKALYGEKNGMYGTTRVFSEASIEKMRASRRRYLEGRKP